MCGRFTVQGDGKGGAKLRQDAEYSSAAAGEISRLAEVRVNKVKELAGGKMRFHIVEVRNTKGTGGKSPTGWASAKMLQCHSKSCGFCFHCSHGVLPSEKKRVQTEAEIMLTNVQAQLSDAKKKIETYEASKLLPNPSVFASPIALLFHRPRPKCAWQKWRRN